MKQLLSKDTAPVLECIILILAGLFVVFLILFAGKTGLQSMKWSRKSPIFPAGRPYAPA